MERLCGRCGALISGDVKFCPNCGAPMKSAVDLGKHDASNAPGAPNFSSGNIPTSGYGAPQYGQSYNPYSPQNVPLETLTASQWIGTFIVCTCLGVISLILNIIWGFCSDMPEPRRSFSRGMILINIVGIVFGIIATAVVPGIINFPF